MIASWGKTLYTFLVSNFKDLAGKPFGRWKVIKFNHTKSVGVFNYQMWDCICICGTHKIVEGMSLKKGNSLSCGCLQQEKIPRGKEHYAWKQDGLGYFGIHKWLKKYYGYATKCENTLCKGESITFQWALMRGKEYERKRENFWQLCRPCHTSYDYGTKKLKV